MPFILSVVVEEVLQLPTPKCALRVLQGLLVLVHRQQLDIHANREHMLLEDRPTAQYVLLVPNALIPILLL